MYNGDIEVNVTSDTENTVVCGGLVACYDDAKYYSFSTEIRHCYNMGDVFSKIDKGVSFAGGILDMADYNTDSKRHC